MNDKSLKDALHLLRGSDPEAAYDAALELDAKDAKIGTLRAALKPFAEFAKAYGPVASTLDYPEDHVLMAAPPVGTPTVLRMSDLVAALKAIGEES